MSDAVIIQAIQTTGIVVLGIAVAWIGQKVTTIHKQLNSMRDQENKTNKELGHAEGKAEGIKEQQQKK